MIAKSFFVEIPNLMPISSATKNTTANKNPPLPSFHPMLMVSGNAAIANRVGLEINKIPAIKLLFCNN